MSELCDWPKSYKNAQLVCKVVLIFRQCIEELSSTLWMANISNFLMTSVLNDIFCNSGDIMISHVLPIVHPECCIPIRIIFYVLSTILISSAVSYPNIISCSWSYKCWCYISSIDDPTISWVEDTVLQKYRWLCSWSSFIDLAWDSKHFEDIPIRCCYWMFFKLESVLCNNFLDWVSKVILNSFLW
jgi:hypothetical protein